MKIVSHVRKEIPPLSFTSNSDIGDRVAPKEGTTETIKITLQRGKSIVEIRRFQGLPLINYK